jgi:hypothetical protein
VEISVRDKNPLSQAIFDKYQKNLNNMMDPVIREEDED